jgi:hypothetical protein
VDGWRILVSQLNASGYRSRFDNGTEGSIFGLEVELLSYILQFEAANPSRMSASIQDTSYWKNPIAR